jgi:hypothetical protein
MRYDQVQGWCDFEWLYREMANKYNNGKVAEVGVWKGRSLLYLAEQMFNRYGGGYGCLFGIDTWAGSDETEHQNYIQSIGGQDSFYQEFLNNIKDVEGNIIPLRGKSTEVAKLFPDGYFDFVFLDASHDYENVKADLIAWKSKIKFGGTFAGHDIEWMPVEKAVREIIPNYNKQGSCWLVNI